MAPMILYSGTLIASCLVVLWVFDIAQGRRTRTSLIVGAVWIVTHVVIAALFAEQSSWLLSDLLVLGTSAFAALALSRSTRSTGALVALAVTASIVDIVSFSTGPTRWLLDSSGPAPQVLRFLAVTIPVDGGSVAVVGIADLAFLAAFYSGLRVTGRAALAVAVGLVGALMLALVVGVVSGGAFGIPFMAAVVIASTLTTDRTAENQAGPG